MKNEPIRSPEAAPDEQASPAKPDGAPASAAARDAAAPEPPADPSFATAGEEDAFWSGVAAGARMLGRELPALPVRAGGAPIVPRAPDEAFADAAAIRAGGRPPEGRVRRHDGWTPSRMIHFLEILAATGCVGDACKAVGMSVSAAYALRDRREGRAWSVAWQAVLQERARHRLSDENLGRAMNGCVEQIVKDGVVVAERRRHDNRLSMAVLTRLDRLAERSDSDDATLLRAVSEDIEDFYDVIEQGGDVDAFIEARRPKPPSEPEPKPEAPRPLDRDLDNVEWVARMVGADPLSDIDPEDLDVKDLDPSRRGQWTTEQWIRAERSGYRAWLDAMAALDRLPPGGQCLAEFEKMRTDFYDATEEADSELGDEASEEDVHRRAAEILLELLGAELKEGDGNLPLLPLRPPEEPSQ